MHSTKSINRHIHLMQQQVDQLADAVSRTKADAKLSRELQNSLFKAEAELQRLEEIQESLGAKTKVGR